MTPIVIYTKDNNNSKCKVKYGAFIEKYLQIYNKVWSDVLKVEYRYERE